MRVEKVDKVKIIPQRLKGCRSRRPFIRVGVVARALLAFILDRRTGETVDAWHVPTQKHCCSPVLLSKNVYMPTGLSLRQPRKTQIQNIICKTHIYNHANAPGRKPGVAFFIISGRGSSLISGWEFTCREAHRFPYFRNLTWSRFSRTRRICSRASLASGTEACTDSMPVRACSYRPSMASSTARA